MNLLPQLSRVMTKGRDFVPQIDGLRFVAIIAVLAYHVRATMVWHYGVPFDSPVVADGSANWIFGAGCKGVELFFAISGFILCLPFARQHLGQGEPVRLKAYYLRRLTRLEPPYLIQLAIFFLAACLVFRHEPAHPELYQQPDWFARLLQHFGVSLFYGSGLIYHDYPTLNLVLWSLEIEVQFYLLAPWLARVFRLPSAPARRLAIIGLMLLPAAVAPWLPAWTWLDWTLLGKLPFFMAGFLFCDLYLGGHIRTERRRYFWDFLFFAILVFIVWGGRFGLDYPFLPWLAVLIFTAAFRGKFFFWLLGRRWITTLGGMCYTIYMYHWLLISGLFHVTKKISIHRYGLDLMLQFAVLSVLVLALCSVLFALFERPFMQRDWPQKFRTWVARKTSAAGPA
jgi:peptidoglycan/LPS O-acetylase OafA/YrhL